MGLALAEALGAEIISLDSMAVYRGMNVGTAKPSLEDRARVPHHLLDMVDPNEEFSLTEYVAQAHQKVDALRNSGKRSLFVGGTPLYLKALLRGLSPGPPADWQFRAEIEKELQEVGVEVLHERLRLVDPLAASRLHPHDKRRIVRALEHRRATGQPISHQQTHFDEPPPDSGCSVFTLSRPRRVLHERIERRVEKMFQSGLVDEVVHLMARFGSLSRTALQAVGYRQVVRHVEGKQTLDETIEQVKARTRQFARRQETWFRSLSECQFISVRPGDSADELVAQILADAQE